MAETIWIVVGLMVAGALGMLLTAMCTVSKACDEEDSCDERVSQH